MAAPAILAALSCLSVFPSAAMAANRDQAASAAIHPIETEAEMRVWLARVPVTRDWPPDFAATLTNQAPVLKIEMTTTPGCVPCADLWIRLSALSRRYGWQLRTIDEREAMIRSARLGLPWVGHPIAWVRPAHDTIRTIPVAVGTDHAANLARNLYLAAKMLTGVRPAVGVRALAKFTGIVAPLQRARRRR